jgi:hypothetical protein
MINSSLGIIEDYPIDNSGLDAVSSQAICANMIGLGHSHLTGATSAMSESIFTITYIFTRASPMREETAF